MHVCRRVETGEADLGVGLLPERHAELSLTVLRRDRFLGVLPKGHGLDTRSRIRLDQLLAYRC